MATHQQLRNANGTLRGTIITEGNRQVCRDARGTLVGTYENGVTRNARGVMVGHGNLLTSLL